MGGKILKINIYIVYKKRYMDKIILDGIQTICASIGILLGVCLIATKPRLFQPLSIISLILTFIMYIIYYQFYNSLIFLIGFGLITGFTFLGIVALFIGTAFLSFGITLLFKPSLVFLIFFSLLLALFIQLIGVFFAPGVFGGSGLELSIVTFGSILLSLIYQLLPTYANQPKNFLVFLYTIEFIIKLIFNRKSLKNNL